MSYLERVIVLVDMDCFYCQVEEILDPNLVGKPIAVVQYNAWRGGGIIAVNYPARDCGVTRHMRGNEAKEKCPQIQLVRVPNVRGKADLTKYREAGKKVAEVLQSFTTLLERASVDEAYLDITESVNNRMKYVDRIHPDQLKNTHVVDFDNAGSYLNAIYSNELMNDSNIKLAWGGVIAEEIRAAVFESTGYRCSAGVAHNKILAKLVAGLHKPNQQTVLPHASIPVLFENMPVKKIRSLGGKFGNQLSEKLDIKNMGELCKFSEKELASHFDEKTASWLYNIARGLNNDPVTVRLVSKSIGCCKKFPGRTALKNHEAIKHWLNELAIEISERLEKDLEENNRKAKQMVVNFAQEVNRKDVSGSRSHPLNSYDANRIMSDAYEVVKKKCLRADDTFRIKFLGISVGKFEDVKNVGSIASFFNRSRKSAGQDFDDENNQNFNNGKDEVKRKNITNCNDDGGRSKSIEVKKNRNSIASFFMTYDNEENPSTSGVSETQISKGCNSTNFTVTSNENNMERVMQSIENIVPSSSSLQTKGFIEQYCDNTESSDKNLHFGKIRINGFVKCEDSDQSNINLISSKHDENTVVHTKIMNLDESHHVSNNFKPQRDNQRQLINNNVIPTTSFNGNKDDASINHSIPIGIENDSVERNGDESNDSITEELQQSANVHNTSSFFNKYMEKLQNPADRYFDTSLVLEEHEDFDKGIDRILNDEFELSQQETTNHLNGIFTTSKSSNLEDYKENLNAISTETYKNSLEYQNAEILNYDKFQNSREYDRNWNQEGSRVPDEFNTNEKENPETLNDGCELCPECNKRIPISEFISHMDYHYALQMVRDEADLYRPVKIEKPATPKKGNKRKSGNCTKLTSFFTPRNEVDAAPKEICGECNKSIPMEEFASHTDYHVAKRIHLELNDFNPVTVKKYDTKPNLKKCDSKSISKGNCKKDKGRSIATFFKPV